MHITRRALLETAALGALAPLAACGTHRHTTLDEQPVPTNTSPLPGFDRTVLGFGPASGAPVLLLHELPGMTPDDLKLADLLGKAGFRVYMPLLFGKVGQDSTVKGYWQACVRGEFECTTRAVRSRVLDRLDAVIDRILGIANRPLGIIGMCLTGILPLALLRNEVSAAVLCQPTVPFNSLLFRPAGSQKSDLGLSPADLAKAVRSPVPFLAMRYASDSLCPPERVDVLAKTFPGRMAVIALPGDGHSVLASSFNQTAYDDTVRYLGVRLGTASGPQMMEVARFDGRPSEITSAGLWRAVSEPGQP